MCGICGTVGLKTDRTTIEKMTLTLAHRGPDDQGQWVGSNAALGHTRLAIIDLSMAGHQPMISDDGRLTMVFNGEIYNYREIREELRRGGDIFHSDSDTEVILLGFRRWGRAVVERLSGMFAFAVWDDAEKELFLARDRIGIKPLFYAVLKNGLVFASEIKAILAYPETGVDLEPNAVDAFMSLGYVPGPETIFKGIRSLLPAHAMAWKDGRITSYRYWEPEFRADSLQEDENELTDALDRRLNETVQQHLVADVPIGAFLSGGLDSSLVAAIAQKHSPERLQTFTIGFGGGGDERAFARAAARHIGSKHRERLVTPELVRKLPILMQHLDQPLFDNSALPTHIVSEFAREHVKVVLSGDGGDEPFAGYDWTRYALSFPRLPRFWTPGGWQWAYQTGLTGLCRRLLYDMGHSPDERYLRRTVVPDRLRNSLYTHDFAESIQSQSVRESLGAMMRQVPVNDPRDRFLYADLTRYLPEDVLFKVDRMSMAHGLEVRVPLLDHKMIEWILRLPFHMRFRRMRGKYLLRKVAARYLPPEIVRPRKQGFTVPVGRWLKNSLGDFAGRIFSSKSFKDRNIIKPAAAMALLVMHRSGRFDIGHRIWALVIFEVWARTWIDRQDASGSLPEWTRD